MKPPSIRANKWDDLPSWQQASLIAYDQIRQIEEMELAAAMVPKFGI